jgi:hypothetical protein
MTTRLMIASPCRCVLCVVADAKMARVKLKAASPAEQVT